MSPETLSHCNSADWSALIQLSSRVRRLHFQMDVLFTAEDLSPSVTAQRLCHVSHALGPEFLFQNLRELSLEMNATVPFDGADATFPTDYKNSIIHFLRVLMRLDLSALRMNFNAARFVHLNLPTFPTCPRMHYLDMEGNSWPEEHEFSSELSKMVLRLPSLEVARCNRISWEVLNCFAQLDALRQLWVDLPGQINPSYRPNTGRNAFPQLTFLDMTTGTLQSSVEFLRLTALDDLTDLNMSCIYVSFNEPTYDASEDIQGLLALIPSQCPKLESIRVNSGVCPLAPLPWVLDMSVLSPYLALRNLRILDIETHYSPALTDDDLAQMARAWPCLEQLHLIKESGWKLPTGLTFQGVVSLVEYCPRLESFSLVFDATADVPSCIPRRPDGMIIQNPGVRYMDVCNSPITSPVKVAAFLSKLLPGLKLIGVDPYIKYRVLWTEVAAQHCGSPQVEMYGQADFRSGCYGLQKLIKEVGEEWWWTLEPQSNSGSDELGDDGGFRGVRRSGKNSILLPFRSLSAL
ncbi:hypothetical protein J3A83DRAFT_4384642 [Scleroderma citrinum]